ncbi:MAG TPA: ABC transporter permease [Bryobacteraceae bacterium]
MHEFYTDIRYAIRGLLRKPGFSAVVLGTLALGIGGNAAILTAAYAIFFSPLPFPHSEQLIRLRAANTSPNGSQNAFNLRGSEILELQSQRSQSPFTHLVAGTIHNQTLTGDGDASLLRVAGIYGDWESVLGVPPVLGRWFSPEEERRGDQSGAVVISTALWTSRYGGAPDVLGRTVSLDHRDSAIVGVMPPAFHFPYTADAWTPVTMVPQSVDDYAVFGRLRPGISLAACAQALTPVAQALQQAYPNLYSVGISFQLQPVRESFVADQRRPALTLASAAIFFLILASFNIASLLLARSVVKSAEVQVRIALGASRWHLLRAGAAEMFVYAVVGAIGGSLLAAQVIPYLRDVIPPVLTRELGMSEKWTAPFLLSLSLILSAFSACLAALPALVNLHATPDGANRSGVRAGRSRRERMWMDTFVVLQFVIAIALIAGAGLMLRNFSRLLHRDLGIDTSHLLAIRVSTTSPQYADAGARQALVDDLVRSAESTPGAAAAAVSTVNPLGGTTWSAPIAVEGREADAPGVTFVVNHRLISPRLFDAMGIRLLQGRAFTDGDSANSPRVAIVSRRMAQKFWPGMTPIGKRVRINRPGQPWLVVVGMVSDVEDSRDTDGPRETWYLPYTQNARTTAAADIVLMVRSAGNPRAIEHAIEQNVHAIHKDLALYDSAAMDGYYLDTLAHQRLSSILAGSLAGFGLLLGALGIYGTLAFSVGERVREIGIRMALGATRGRITRLIVQQGMRLAVAASLLGIGAAWAVGRMLASQLSEIRPDDPMTIAGAAAILLVVAAIAVYGPARRAAGLDPIASLRRE